MGDEDKEFWTCGYCDKTLELKSARSKGSHRSHCDDWKNWIRSKLTEQFFLNTYYDQGKSVSEIADQFNTSTTTVTSIMEDMGLERRSMEKTHDEFLMEFRVVHGDKYEVLSPYKNRTTKISVRCDKCGCDWKATPANLVFGETGCPDCGKEKVRKVNKHPNAEQKFLQSLEDIYGGHIQVMGQYKDARTKVTVKCICGHVWKKTPMNLRRQGCMACYRESRRKDHDQFLREVGETHGDAIKVIGEYTTARDSIECECLLCGHEWAPVPYSLTRGTGCPRCCVSKGEQKIASILDENHIHYEQEFSFPDLSGMNGGKLAFDFAVLTEESAVWYLIEYDGVQHFEPVDYFGGKEKFDVQKENDGLKDAYCKENRIPLIRIPYTQYPDIEREDVLWRVK